MLFIDEQNYTLKNVAQDCATSYEGFWILVENGVRTLAQLLKLQTDDPLPEIRSTVDTPLVLHGGSGLSDDDFKNTVREGIAKVNIFTDLCLAGAEGFKAGLDQGMSYLEARNLKVEYIKEAVKKKIILFGSQNKG